MCVPPSPDAHKKARDGHGCLLNSGSEGFLALNCMPFLFFRKARTCLPLTSQNMLFEEQLGFCALKCLLFFLEPEMDLLESSAGCFLDPSTSF